MTVARRTPGPAYANLQWRKPRRCGEVMRQTLWGFDGCRRGQSGPDLSGRSFGRVNLDGDAAAVPRPAKANASVSAAHQCHLVESAAGRTISGKPSSLIS